MSDDINLFEQADRKERQVVGRRMQKSIDESRARANEQAKPDKHAVESIKKFTTDTTERMIHAQYKALGLEPPASRPLVSITLLLQMGWRIEDGPVHGERVLVAPPERPAYVPKDRNNPT